MCELKNMVFKWSVGMVSKKDMGSVSITVMPSNYTNCLNFNIQLGNYNPLVISKRFEGKMNLSTRVLENDPNNSVVDEFCEKIKNFNFKKLEVSNRIISPQEGDIYGVNTIIYEMSDNSNPVIVENPNNQGLINLCWNFILGFILKDVDLRRNLIHYVEDNGENECSNLKELLKHDILFNPKENFDLENFENEDLENISKDINKINIQDTKVEGKNQAVTVDDLLSKIDSELDKLDNSKN